MTGYNLEWVSAQVTCLMIPSWYYIIWKTEVMALGLLSEGLLIEPHVCFTLFISEVFGNSQIYMPRMGVAS